MEGQFDPNLYCTGQLCHWQAHEVSGFLVSNLGKNHHCQFCESLYIRSTPYVLGVIETIRERALSANLPATLHARYHADNYAAFRDVSRKSLLSLWSHANISCKYPRCVPSGKWYTLIIVSTSESSCIYCIRRCEMSVHRKEKSTLRLLRGNLAFVQL